MQVERLSPDELDVDELAAILVAGHAAHAPLGAHHLLADTSTARDRIVAACATGPVFVAKSDAGATTAFLASPSTGYLGAAHHGAVGDVRSAYRSLYGAAAAELVATGTQVHSVPLLVEADLAVRTFFELGFGVDQIDGIVPVPPQGGPPPAAVRVATADDLDAVMALATELQEFHTASPMFQSTAGFDADAIRRGAEGALDDDRSTVVVAAGEGRSMVGMAQAGPSSAYADTFDIGMLVVTEGRRGNGIGTAILELLLVWGATAGYGWATVGWTSSNPISDGFYRARGFVPVRYRLRRTISRRS
jgi:GNAT superfamily N-acetyltransferase